MACVPLHRVSVPLVLVIGSGVCAWLPCQVVIHLTRSEGKQLTSTDHLLQNVVPTHAQDYGGRARGEQGGLGGSVWGVARGEQ